MALIAAAGFFLTLLLWIYANIGRAPQPGVPLFPPNIAANQITSPLDENGDVDYLAYVNNQGSADVTVDNNALVKIIEAVGPKPEGAELPPDFYQLLGIAAPPADGDYYMSFGEWLEQYPKRNQAAEAQHFQTYSEPYAFHLSSFMMEQPWTGAQFSDAKDYLAFNQNKMDIIIEGLSRERYYHPKVPNTDKFKVLSSLLPYAQTNRELARHFAMRSNLKWGEGDFAGAVDEASHILRLAELSSQSGTLVEQLVAIAIQGIGTAQLGRIATHPDIPLADLERIKKILEKANRLTGTKNSVDIGERAMSLDAVQSTFRHGQLDLSGLAPQSGSSKWMTRLLRTADPEQAMIHVNQQFNNLVELFETGTPAQQLRNMDQLEDDLRAIEIEVSNFWSNASLIFRGRGARGEQVGKILAAMLLPALKQVFTAEIRSHTNLELLRLLVELEIHKKKTGSYPKNLSSLVPDQIPQLPSDPFSDKSFGYRIEKDGTVVLYSLGLNNQDDAGEGELHNSSGADDHKLPLEPIKDWASFLKEKK